jgi:hypothetical protein
MTGKFFLTTAQGTAWIDEEDHVLAKIDFELMKDAKLGGGLIVNINDGSHDPRMAEGESGAVAAGKLGNSSESPSLPYEGIQHAHGRSIFRLQEVLGRNEDYSLKA